MKYSFKKFLQEAPLHDYQTFGNWDKNSSFRDPRDRKIIQHPKAIERVRKKFGNTNYDFDFYFVNSPKANKHTEVGFVNLDWVQKNLDADVYNAVAKDSDDHIKVIFTNNKGSERVPMTAWMMAHRIGHALARKDGMRGNQQYQYASDHLIQQFNGIMEAYGEQSTRQGERGLYGNRTSQRLMIHFFQEVCTFKSAREHNLRDWFEVLNELIAQYLTTGKIKFKPAPRCFGGGSGANKIRRCIKNQEDLEDVNDNLEMMGRDMGTLIDDILSSVVNGILVM